MIKRASFFNTRLPFRNLKLISTLTIILLLTWRCISPPDFIGGDLLPPQDIPGIRTDTSFTISAFTIEYDTLITTGFTDAIVGETYDEIFGHTRSSFLTQLQPSFYGKDWGINAQVDSAILYLGRKGKLGNEPMQINVYELIDTLSKHVKYNAFDPVDEMYDPTLRGATVEPFTGNDEVLRIRLSNQWIQQTFVDIDTVLFSAENFFNHFYGIYVRPSTTTTLTSSGQGMYSFDFNSPSSRLVVYYTNDEHDTDTLSLSYPFFLQGQNTQRFNHFEHDFEVAQDDLKLRFNPPTEDQESVFYLKSLGGAMGVMLLDDIVEWANKMPISINRAELRIEREEQDAIPEDALLEELFLFTMDDGKRVNILDFIINSETFDGRYNRSKQFYSFNITNHFQSILKSNDPNKKLYVEGKFANARANNAVLRSGNHPEGPIKLIITYTKF